MTLTGLDERDAGELIGGLSTRPLPEELSRAIWEETEGSPFFLEEMLRHIESRPATGDGAPSAWDVHDLPESIREVIGQRLAAMSERTSQALRTAAVIGREFSFELLEAVGPLGEDELYDVIDESVAAHVIGDVPAEYGRYTFTHSLIRQTLYDGITTMRRARLHAAVAEALERLSAGGEPPLAELAHHFSLAPPALGARAVEYAERAARRALDELAYEEAARLYGMALRALGEDTAEQDRRCGLLLRLGETQAKSGEVAAARTTFGRAAEVARRQDSPRELARAALGYGTVGQMSGGVVDAGVVALLEEALTALGEGDAALRARLLARLAMELSFSEQRERRAQLSEEALRLARGVGDTRGLGYALVARHWSLWGPANVDERLVAANDLLRLAESTHDERLEMQGRRWRMIDLLELGDIDGVDVEIAAYEQLAARRRRPSEAAYSPLFRAMRHLLAGEFDAAAAFSERARRLGERVQDTNALQAHVLQQFALWRERGGVERHRGDRPPPGRALPEHPGLGLRAGARPCRERAHRGGAPPGRELRARRVPRAAARRPVARRHRAALRDLGDLRRGAPRRAALRAARALRRPQRRLRLGVGVRRLGRAPPRAARRAARRPRARDRPLRDRAAHQRTHARAAPRRAHATRPRPRATGP